MKTTTKSLGFGTAIRVCMLFQKTECYVQNQYLYEINICFILYKLSFIYISLRKGVSSEKNFD
jgi:hypothetical protein